MANQISSPCRRRGSGARAASARRRGNAMRVGICVRRGRRGVVRMWAGFVGARSASLGPDLLDKLSALGLEVAELPTGGVGPGLVVFDEASDIVCELVSEASR